MNERMSSGVMLIFIGWRAYSHSTQVLCIPEVIKVALRLENSGNASVAVLLLGAMNEHSLRYRTDHPKHLCTY
jgi:hypothetical protein